MKEATFTLEELFQDRLFVIPDYQRGYAWEKQQWNDFIEDLELLDLGRDHYTGTVILHARGEPKLRDEDDTEYERFDVVDGQQRLTTASLLIECLARRFDLLGNRRATGIRKKYLAVKDSDNNVIYKLTLQPDQHALFIRHIIERKPLLDSPETISASRLLDACRFFNEYLEKKVQSLGTEAERWLSDFCDKLAHHLRFLRYHVDDDAEVGVIFEVTNDRGKELSELEKVKNYLLYLASKVDSGGTAGLAATVNKVWGGIFSRLMERGLTRRSDEDGLLRVHWLLAYDADERNWNGAKSVKEQFQLRNYRDREGELKKKLLDYAKSLGEIAIAYTEVSAPNNSLAFAAFGAEANNARRWVEKLHRIDVIAPFLPLLAACRISWVEAPGDFVNLVKLLERFSFRAYRIEEYRSNAARARLFRIGSDVWREGLKINETLARVLNIASDFLSDGRFRQLMQEPKKNWYWWIGLRYFLYEYEEDRAHEGGKAPMIGWEFFRTHPDTTVEHILPQTPDKECWTSRFNKLDVEQCLHDLGNLCLTEDNSSYSNKCFAEKKGQPGIARCYANANLFQERELCLYEHWTPDTVRTRKDLLLTWASRRWAIEGLIPHPDIQPTPNEDDEVEAASL